MIAPASLTAGITGREAWQFWRRVAGPFARFVLPTPFVLTTDQILSPQRQTGDPRVLPRIDHRHGARTRIVDTYRFARGLPTSTAVVIDLPLTEGLVMTRALWLPDQDLSHVGHTSPLPTDNPPTPWVVVVVGRTGLGAPDTSLALLYEVTTPILHQNVKDPEVQDREREQHQSRDQLREGWPPVTARSFDQDWWREPAAPYPPRGGSTPAHAVWFILDGDRSRAHGGRHTATPRSEISGEISSGTAMPAPQPTRPNARQRPPPRPVFPLDADHLPRASSLCAAGVTDVLVIGRQTVPAEDLAPIVAQWVKDGLGVAFRQ